MSSSITFGTTPAAQFSVLTTLARQCLGHGGGVTSRQDALDLATEAYLRLVGRYGREALDAREPPHFRGLAKVTVRNLATDAHRRRRFECDDPSAIDTHPDPVDLGRRVEEGQDLIRLRAVLAGLAEPERRFLLAVFESGSVPVAQREASWPPKSPYYHLRRLLEALRGAMT